MTVQELAAQIEQLSADEQRELREILKQSNFALDMDAEADTQEAIPLAANEATRRARAKLAAAGALSTVWKAPPGTVPPTDDELIELGTLPPGSPSMLDLVNEDRGER